MNSGNEDPLQALGLGTVDGGELLFGGKKIPELMKGLGKGVKEFKDASKNENKEDTDKEKTSTETKKE